jgi:hypothetical protein
MDTDNSTTEQAQRIQRQAVFTVTYLTWLADKLSGPKGADYALPAAEALRWMAEGVK